MASSNRQHGHRLGGLFKKKGSADARFDAEAEGLVGASESQFPSPSFIRPKSSRMMARDEIASIRTSPKARALSLPDHPVPTRGSFAYGKHPSAASIANIQYSPIQSMPLMRRRDISVPELKTFQFPPRGGPVPEIGELSPTSLSSSCLSPTQVPLPKSGRRIDSIDERTVFVPPRIHTPPASDRGSVSVDDGFINKQLPPLPNDMPTPGPSPDMAAISDSRLSDPRVSEILNSTLYSDIERTLDNAIPRSTSLRKSRSYSHLPATRCSSIYSVINDTTILREPTFNDFLNLSDDDIAEAHVETPQPIGPPPEFPPSPPPTAKDIPVCKPQFRPGLLTLPPPFTGSPATAGAFEAARIAARYGFDLVYVINLWPEETSDPMMTPTRSEAQTGLTGRLLAAYGLSNVKSPFRISTAVHTKILQGDGWIEYRNAEAQEDDFARGYACAFHTGQYSRRPSIDSVASMSMHKRSFDRGIVFAAYRKPSPHGSTTVGCSKDELESIRQDAGALVKTLIDIHAANRLRQSPSSRSLPSDETGPMPVLRPAIL
jgi:hypothetical protein